MTNFWDGDLHQKHRDIWGGAWKNPTSYFSSREKTNRGINYSTRSVDLIKTRNMGRNHFGPGRPAGRTAAKHSKDTRFGNGFRITIIWSFRLIKVPISQDSKNALFRVCMLVHFFPRSPYKVTVFVSIFRAWGEATTPVLLWICLIISPYAGSDIFF